MLIVNGRVGKDASFGRLTCKNVSLIDYAICSPCLFSMMEDFCVWDFDECFSDVHCAIELRLNVNLSDDISFSSKNERVEENRSVFENISSTEFLKVVWKEGSECEFQTYLDEEKIDILNDSMTRNFENVGAVSQNDIDNMTEDVCGIMTDAASKLGMYKKLNLKQIKGRRVKHDPSRSEFKKKFCWFDKECQKKRTQFRNAKARYKFCKSANTNMQRCCAHKAYKRVIKKSAIRHTLVKFIGKLELCVQMIHVVIGGL